MRLDESLKCVLSQKDVIIRRFYDRFLKECPEARPLFAGVDLQVQSLMLTTTLIVVEEHYEQHSPAIEHYLHVLGDRHRNAGVPRELFPKFCDCLIETIQECHPDDDWSADLADAWRAALDHAVQVMFEGYKRDYPF